MRSLILILALLPLLAQPPADGKKKGGPPRPPQNLKVLKVPAGDATFIRTTMGEYRTALGVQCQHCHVQGNFASDDNPKKEMARHMITMTEEINAKFPDGKVHVTCFTCHRGGVMPETMAAAAVPAPGGPPPPPAPPK